MAESFCIHFKSADWEALHKVLISATYWFEDIKEWRYPSHVGGGEYRMSVDNVRIDVYNRGQAIVNPYPRILSQKAKITFD